jgi:peptide/nickel transport system permease protein
MDRAIDIAVGNVGVLDAPANSPASPTTAPRQWSLHWPLSWPKYPVWLGDWAVLAPALIVAVLVVCAAAPGLLAPFEPTDMDIEAILQAPGAQHLLGTDQFGRDVLSLLIYGARQSLLMGAFAVFIGGIFGGLIGLASGYLGSYVDAVLMRAIDIKLAVPGILLAIVVSTALGASLTNTIIAVGLISVPRYARVMRSQVIAIKNRPFVEAARSIGTSQISILFKHILPHCWSPMLVMATLGVGSSILIGSSLSFLGLGIIDDRPDWGFLLSQGRSYLSVAWWIATFPGLAITALVVSVNLLGDELRHRVDPQKRVG